MKILFYTDTHWCANSSIVRGRGDKYSIRLENLIKSINWAEEEAAQNDCSYVIHLGDFFDKSLLDAEEISALNELHFHNVPHMFLVGNHEIGRADNIYSSTHLFNLVPDSTVIAERCEMVLGNRSVLFLPYCLEKNRVPIAGKYDYIFSHNDIKGFNFGRFISEEGYDQEEINASCIYFINGHLHNSMYVGDKIVNLGNLTGQNFSEDALSYSHYILILDTDTNELTFVENPYALNFYKLGEIREERDIPELKPQAIITATVPIDKPELKELLTQKSLCNRITFNEVEKYYSENTPEFKAIDHLDKFVEFISANMEMTDLVKSELNKIVSA